MTATSPAACSMPRVTRSVNRHTIDMVTAGCVRRAAMGGCARGSPRCSTWPLSSNCSRDRDREPGLRRRPGHRPRNPRPRTTRQTAAPHRSGIPTARFRDPADRHGGPPRHRGDRGGPGLHQPLGQSALAHTLTTTDFRTGHRPSWRGGRDRQTWPRTGDQATAGRTPHGQRTAAGTPPARPDPQPSTTPRRRGSSGPPTRPPRGMPVHRKTPTASGQHRSGRTGLTPAHQLGTVPG